MSTDPKPIRISVETVASFKKKEGEIVRAVVARALQFPAEVGQHGNDAERLLTAGLNFTSWGLEAAMLLGNTALLDFQLSWAYERLAHDGVQPEHLLHRLQLYADAVREFLPPTQAEAVSPYLEWMIARQRKLMAPYPNAAQDR